MPCPPPSPRSPVWRNELGGLTFRLGSGRYVKWLPANAPEGDLAAEAERLAWAGRWVPVPRVLAHGADAEGTTAPDPERIAYFRLLCDLA